MASPHDLFRKEVKVLGGVDAAARALGCTTEYIYMIMSGSRRPGRDMAGVIESLTEKRLPMIAWVRRRRGKAA